MLAQTFTNLRCDVDRCMYQFQKEFWITTFGRIFAERLPKDTEEQRRG